MKQQRISRRNLASTTIAALLLLTLSASQSAAFNPQPAPTGSVAVSVAAGQFARISLVNTTNRVLGIVPCVCPATLSLVDANGAILAESSIDAQPGAIESFDVSVPMRRNGSPLVRAYVEFDGDEGSRMVCNGGSRASLALVDESSGKTELVVPIVTSFAVPE